MKMMGNLWQVGSVEYTLAEDATIYLIRFSTFSIYQLGASAF
jgi:hypothetical protein